MPLVLQLGSARVEAAFACSVLIASQTPADFAKQSLKQNAEVF